MYEIIFMLIIVVAILVGGLLIVNRFIGGVMPDFGKGFVDVTTGIQEKMGSVFGGIGEAIKGVGYRGLYLEEIEMERKRTEQEHVQRVREQEALYEMVEFMGGVEISKQTEEVWTGLEEKAQERIREYGHPYATGRTEETGAFMYDSKTGEYTYF